MFLVCKCKCTSTMRQDHTATDAVVSYLMTTHCHCSPHRLIAVVVPDLDGDLSLEDYPVTIAQTGIQF